MLPASGSPGTPAAASVRIRAASPGRLRTATTSASGRRIALRSALDVKSRSCQIRSKRPAGSRRRRAEHGGADPEVARVAAGDRRQPSQRLLAADFAQREGDLEADANARVIGEPCHDGLESRQFRQPRLGQQDGVLANVRRRVRQAASSVVIERAQAVESIEGQQAVARVLAPRRSGVSKGTAAGSCRSKSNR